MMIGLCTDIFFSFYLWTSNGNIVGNDSSGRSEDDGGEEQGVTCERYSR